MFSIESIVEHTRNFYRQCKTYVDEVTTSLNLCECPTQEASNFCPSTLFRTYFVRPSFYRLDDYMSVRGEITLCSVVLYCGDEANIWTRGRGVKIESIGVALGAFPAEIPRLLFDSRGRTLFDKAVASKVGEELIGAKLCYVIRVVPGFGIPKTVWIDADQFFIRKMTLHHDMKVPQSLTKSETASADEEFHFSVGINQDVDMNLFDFQPEG